MTEPTSPHWHVLGGEITEDTELSPHGTGLRQLYVVPFRVDSGPATGHRGTVKIAPEDFNAQHVQDQVRGAVGQLHSIASLKHADAELA